MSETKTYQLVPNYTHWKHSRGRNNVFVTCTPKEQKTTQYWETLCEWFRRISTNKYVDMVSNCEKLTLSEIRDSKTWQTIQTYNICHWLKAPLHGTICPHGACRLPCTWVNRNVWHVARMSRTRENRVNRIYSSFYFRADCAPELCDYPIRAQQTPKTTFTLYDYERETGSV